jgi:hypothetical protein
MALLLGPQWRGRLKPKRMGKQSPVRHARVAKKAIDPVEEDLQPFFIEARGHIVANKPRPQPIIAPIDERESHESDAANDGAERL